MTNYCAIDRLERRSSINRAVFNLQYANQSLNLKSVILQCLVWPVALLLWVVGMPATASAQPRPSRGAFEVGGAALWIGGSVVGERKATETRNQTGSADRLTLFAVDARMRSAPGINAHIAFNVTSTIAVEGGFTYSRPSIATSITSDFEGSPNVTLSDSSLQQYFADGGVVFHVTPLRLGSRTLPFLAVSAGYLRQVTEGGVLVTTGRVYGIGGGFKQMLTPNGRIGLRVDLKLGVRDGGMMLDEHHRRPFFVVGAGTFMMF